MAPSMLRPASKFRVAGFRPRAPNGRQSHPQIPRCWPSACPERLGAINLPTQGNLVAANARHDMTCTLFFFLTPSLHRADSELRWNTWQAAVPYCAVPCPAMPCHATPNFTRRLALSPARPFHLLALHRGLRRLGPVARLRQAATKSFICCTLHEPPVPRPQTSNFIDHHFTW